MTLSIQLWSVRLSLQEDGWESTLARLVDSGFTQVEPFALHLVRGELVPALQRSGLDTPTAHGFLGEEARDATLDVAHELGVGTVFQPHIDEAGWRDLDAIAETARMLRTAHDRASEVGIRVGFHNHEYELQHRVGGRPAFWRLLDLLPDDIVVEYDIYWAAIAGASIVDDLHALGDRVAALHVKDGPWRGTAQDQVALGEGDLPLHDIVAAAPHALAVLSLDRMPGDSATVWNAVDHSRAWADAELVR